MNKALVATAFGAFMCLTTAATAQDTLSGNYMLPHCQAPNTLMAAWCHGNVQAAGYLGSALPAPYKSCVPAGVTPEQSVRVVVQYLNARPHRLHDPFIALATEALAQTIRCPLCRRCWVVIF